MSVSTEFCALGDGPAAELLLVEEGFAEPVPSDCVRIILSERPGLGEPNTLQIPQSEFFRSPEQYLTAGWQLADSTREVVRLEKREELHRRVQELLELPELELVFERVVEDTTAMLNLACGELLVHDSTSEEFVSVYRSGTCPALEPSQDLVAKLHNMLRLSFPFHVERSEQETQVFIPLQLREDLVGIFQAYASGGQQLDEGQLCNVAEYLGEIAGLVSHVHQLTRSKDLVMRDDLTKAFNRRFFDSYLDEEIERTRRYGSVFSIIFLDLDDLKLVNNRHGHLVGSRVLQEVAKRILGAVRNIDKVVRFGGDEFCIVLPETDKGQAANVASRVKRSLIESEFRIDENITVSITASFGIASYPDHALTKENLIRQADEAMYRVKSGSKNAIGIAGQPEPLQPGSMTG